MTEEAKDSVQNGSGDRLKLKSEFLYVRANGRKHTSSCVLMLSARTPSGGERIMKYGVICSRKFDKRAVRRNRAKRLIHEALRRMKKEMEILPCRIIFIPRREILRLKMNAVAEQLRTLMERAGTVPASRK